MKKIADRIRILEKIGYDEITVFLEKDDDRVCVPVSKAKSMIAAGHDLCTCPVVCNGSGKPKEIERFLDFLWDYLHRIAQEDR